MNEVDKLKLRIVFLESSMGHTMGFLQGIAHGVRSGGGTVQVADTLQGEARRIEKVLGIKKSS